MCRLGGKSLLRTGVFFLVLGFPKMRVHLYFGDEEGQRYSSW